MEQFYGFFFNSDEDFSLYTMNKPDKIDTMIGHMVDYPEPLGITRVVMNKVIIFSNSTGDGEYAIYVWSDEFEGFDKVEQYTVDKETRERFTTYLKGLLEEAPKYKSH